MLFRKINLKVYSTLVLMFSFMTIAGSQVISDTLPVKIMFYNVENFFDTRDDTLTDDEEFLPEGLMRWNQTRYRRKINSVYKTITAAGGWEPPHIIAFCEIENRKVLEDLVYGTGLSNYNYGIIHEDSPDFRGIDVCMVFRKDLVKILEYRSMIPEGINKKDFHSRSVLYVRCAMHDDTLNLLINHWPSRRGGVLAGEPLRNEIALMVRNTIDSLCISKRGITKTVILGDFNCEPDDQVIQLVVNSNESKKCSHVNLAEKYKVYPAGTYRYMGVWEMLDQVIVSDGLINCSRGIFVNIDSFRIFNPGFLLKNDSKYPGQTTFSTFSGYRYQGGFSDHLPVLLYMGLR